MNETSCVISVEVVVKLPPGSSDVDVSEAVQQARAYVDNELSGRAFEIEEGEEGSGSFEFCDCWEDEEARIDIT